MRFLYLFFFVLIFQTQLSAQWSRGKNNIFSKLSVFYLSADEHFTTDGETDPNATRVNFNVALYGEYGLTDKLDAIVFFPFFARVLQNDQVSGTNGDTLQEGESLNSVGDLDVGLRYAFFKKKNWAAAVTLQLGIPSGEKTVGVQTEVSKQEMESSINCLDWNLDVLLVSSLILDT